MLTVTDSRDNTETIDVTESVAWATATLVEYLHENCADDYRATVLEWWKYNRETSLTISNGVDSDTWVWVGN